VPEVVAAAPVPVDVYVMLDQSGSMGDPTTGGTKWSQVGSGIVGFAGGSAPRMPAIGLQYFGLPSADVGMDSCVAADYAVADVEIAASPGVAGTLTTSLAAHGPISSTPMSAALQGAVDHAHAWGVAHADHAVAAVLITDGLPTDCDTDLGTVAAIASTAAALPTAPVRTFVIALGSGLDALDAIAVAGDTGAADHLDPSAAGLAAATSDALLEIRAEASCAYAVPAPTTVDALDVQYTPPGGAAQALPRVDDLAHCAGDGWYADSASRLSLCPATCADVFADDDAGAVELLLDC
jgi:hypothetical protein